MYLHLDVIVVIKFLITIIDIRFFFSFIKFYIKIIIAVG